MHKNVFKLYARAVGRSEMVLTMNDLSSACCSFVDYARDSAGSVIGIVVSCDLGHGYDFDHGRETVTLLPHEEHRFIHAYTDTSDGDWYDGSFTMVLKLLPYDEAPENYARGIGSA